MKNKKRLNQKIQNKKNQRKNRVRKGTDPYTGIKYYGAEYKGRELRKLSDINFTLPKYMKKIPTNPNIEEGYRKNYIEKIKSSSNPLDVEIEEGMNAEGYPFVKMSTPPSNLIADLEIAPPKMTYGVIKLMNEQRLITPNGNQIPYGRSLEDAFFNDKDLNNPIPIRGRMLTNSTYWGLVEEDGFTEELLRNPKEMQKYMFLCVRILFEEEHFIDCPIDFYSELFLSPEVPLKLVS